MKGRVSTCRRTAFAGWILIFGLIGTAGAPGAWAQAGSGSSGPTGDAPQGAPHSRLTLAGQYSIDAYSQRNFFLGAASDPVWPQPSDRDAFVTQELDLRPRFILSDDLNLSASLCLAQGVWGWNLNTTESGTSTTSSTYRTAKSTRFRLDWAFAAYRNAPTGTRWYIGRQKFGLGNLLILDEDASGIQVYKDLPGLHSSLGLGYAKQSESSSILHGGDAGTAAQAPHAGDADLYYLELVAKSEGGGARLNPFFVLYDDRSTSGKVEGLTGTTFLPDGLGYLDARFRPQISKATIFGASTDLHRGPWNLAAEFDLLKGKDRIKNSDFGAGEAHDVNDGTLKGYNLYGQLFFQKPLFDLGAAVGMGSGDDDARRGPGNFNYLHNQGHFSMCEIWGAGLALDELGLAPQGLGNPYSRGYRGLENARIMQGKAVLHPGSKLSLALSYSIINSAREVKAFYRDGATGLVAVAAYGHAKAGGPWEASTELGKEIDARLDWKLLQSATLSLRAGSFKPGAAAGYLINGNKTYQKTVTQLHLGLTIPIGEFSLGG
jgi:hypothetical protein